MSVAQTSVQKTAALRIQRALNKPGAIGMKGLLLWTEAAFPRQIAQKVIQAASQYVPGATAVPLMSPSAQGFGRFGGHGMFGRVGAFGDDSSVMTYTLPGVDDAASAAIAAANDPTQAPVSDTTAATPSQPASPSWMADIGNAFKVASQAWLGAQQVKDAQSIFNINLTRAQQGLPPIATNPTQYGLPAPTANIGLTSGTQTALLVGVGVLAVALIAGAAVHKRG